MAVVVVVGSGCRGRTSEGGEELSDWLDNTNTRAHTNTLSVID